jgi:predicted nucleic acid-binding protein
MNGPTTDLGHRTATGMLGRLEAGGQFDVVGEPAAVWTAGVDLFGRCERLSLADAVIVAAPCHHDIGYPYSFDTDFHGLDGRPRLPTPANPYGPPTVTRRPRAQAPYHRAGNGHR